MLVLLAWTELLRVPKVDPSESETALLEVYDVIEHGLKVEKEY